MTAQYLERFLNYGLTREELQSGRPIIGIAQTGGDLVPCNRHHLALAGRVRDAGGVPFKFPASPLQETGNETAYWRRFIGRAAQNEARPEQVSAFPLSNRAFDAPGTSYPNRDNRAMDVIARRMPTIS